MDHSEIRSIVEMESARLEARLTRHSVVMVTTFACLTLLAVALANAL